MDEIERKTIQDIKDYVKSLDTPDNKVYKENSLLIMCCFSNAIEFIEQNAKLRQPAVSGSLPLTDDIIDQIALDYLKEVGSVDRKDLIYHDFTKGAMAYRDEQKRRQ